MADHPEDKDVPMEDQEVDTAVEGEDELLGNKDSPAKKNTEEKKKEKEEEETDPYDDSGAASEVEFGAEDDRSGQADQESWIWHIEMYPLSPEDTALDNFVKLVTTADHSNVMFKTNENGEKRGEAHFYTNDSQAAKIVIRTICCRKFSVIRPFVYLYYKHEDGEIESAALRLDLIEAAKMRWDRQRKNIGDPSTRVAKVSDVPLSTTKELLNVLFARAFHIKRESDESEEADKKASEADAKSKETNNEDDKDDEEKDESNEEDEEELVGEFNGNLTIDCVSRTSLKGFLLGYRKVVIGNVQVNIKALSVQDFNMEELRREVRKKRKEEANQLMGSKSGKPEDSRSSGKGGGNKDARGGQRGGRGARGGTNRGGRGDYRNTGRGGIMTGRQKMEEKMKRGGGRDLRGGGREMRGGGRGFGIRDDMQYQMAMNTYRLERQMISMRGRSRGYGLLAGGYRDFHPDPYDIPHYAPRGGFSDYDPRDDWGYRSAPGPRYGDGMGVGRIPLRGLRGRRL
ncbi:uncharacterized protein LOC143279772 [Babylonia areolata]|uniref:uncharacterized protein LOC143279772 n=1 Tax=Babylonia areolata TaxID=304850 RepID=UPI003FCF4097